MKNYKRIVAAVLTILTVLALTGCRENVTAGDSKAWIPVNDIQANGAFSDEGFYFGDLYRRLRFADLNSGVSVVLCSKAGCTHEGSGCEARGVVNRLFFANDQLYSFDFEGNEFVLSRQDKTGMGLMTVGTVGTQYLAKEKVVTLMSWAAAGNYMYYQVDVAGFRVDEESGGRVYSDELRYIGRMDLKTGTEEILVEEPLESFYEQLILIGVQDGAVLFAHHRASNVTKEDKNYTDILYNDPISLNVWTEADQKVTQLTEKKYKDFNNFDHISDGKLYFLTFDEQYYSRKTYDLETGKVQKLYTCKGDRFLGGGYMLFSDPEDNVWKVYHMGAKDPLPVELSVGIPNLIAASPTGAAVFTNQKNEEGIQERKHFYIAHESLADGLQDSDLQLFHTDQYTN